jgi:hypothetical protein
MEYVATIWRFSNIYLQFNPLFFPNYDIFDDLPLIYHLMSHIDLSTFISGGIDWVLIKMYQNNKPLLINHNEHFFNSLKIQEQYENIFKFIIYDKPKPLNITKLYTFEDKLPIKSTDKVIFKGKGLKPGTQIKNLFKDYPSFIESQPEIIGVIDEILNIIIIIQTKIIYFILNMI